YSQPAGQILDLLPLFSVPHHEEAAGPPALLDESRGAHHGLEAVQRNITTVVQDGQRPSVARRSRPGTEDPVIGTYRQNPEFLGGKTERLAEERRMGPSVEEDAIGEAAG